ncbi:MAG: SGNH/GDSL hydrolase family protein [Aeromonas sp.]|uniref:SGNH/GDSL hydrolase family protein n=1 Tax=Aeromonas sp. TaxID=647 RepID=UPI003F3FFCB3
MYWPDRGSGVPDEPARRPVASLIRQYFTEGGLGQAPTIPGADWFNQVTNELLNVLAEAGIDPSKSDDSQLTQSIYALQTNWFGVSAGASRVGTHGGDNVQHVLDDIHGGVDVRHIVSDLDANNRNAIFNHVGKVFVPRDVVVRCNLNPDDDVRKFVGFGTVITTDQWGNEHALSISAVNQGPTLTAKQMLSRANVALGTMAALRVGCIGDSISDGAWAGAFTSPNPTDANGDLSSSNYTHGASEATGSKSWFSLLINNMIGLAGHNLEHPRAMFTPCNAASSGKSLATGWAYRNFDFGFFQNQAYGKKAPDVLFISMGTNDVEAFRTPSQQDVFLDQCDALVAKAAGYGCKAVCFVAMTHWHSLASSFYEATFKHISSVKPTVDFINAAKYLEDYSNASEGSYTSSWQKVPAIGGGFDPVHPSTDGHKILAGAVAFELMNDRFSVVSDGSRFVAAQAGRVQAWTAPNDQLTPFGVTVSDPWLLPELGWPIYQTNPGSSGLDVTIRHFLWCNEELDLRLIEPKTPLWPSGASKTSIINIMRGSYDESSVSSEPLASTGNDIPSYLSTVVKKLPMGMNIIDVVYHNVINVYAPIMEFSCSRYTDLSVGPFAINIPASTARLCRQSTELERLSQQDVRLPSLGADWLVTVLCEQIPSGVALLGWFDIYAGTAYAVLKVSATEVHVCSVTSGIVMTVIQSVSGDFSGVFSVHFVQTLSGGLVQIEDSSLASHSIPVANCRGGSIGLANTTSAPSRVRIHGYRVEIPTDNGTINF